MLRSSLCVHQQTYAYSCTGGLLLVNLARQINEGDLTNSCRIMVFSGVLTRFLGTYSWSELGRHQKRSWICTFWPPPKETPATRAVKFPHLCFEFFFGMVNATLCLAHEGSSFDMSRFPGRIIWMATKSCNDVPFFVCNRTRYPTSHKNVSATRQT